MSKRPFVLARACASICLVATLAAALSSSIAGGRVYARAQAPGPVQDRAEIERDVQELRQYRLTMPKVKQMAAATLAYAQAQSRDPRVLARRQREKELTALEAKSEARLTAAEQKQLEELRASWKPKTPRPRGGATTWSRRRWGTWPAASSAEPDLANAIRSTGLTTREYRS